MGNISKTPGNTYPTTTTPIIQTKEEQMSLEKLDVKSAADKVLNAERSHAENLSGRKVTVIKTPNKISKFMLKALKNATAPRKI